MKRLSLVILLSGYPIMCTSCAPSTRPRIAVIAHRGDSKQAPENTLAAFRRATKTGAHYVELDARPSADGTLYCLHDATLDRTTNAVRVFGRSKVAIKDVHDKEIDQLDAGSWFGKAFAGERVPTLAAALDTIQPKARTLLEQKGGSAEAYVRLLREKKLVGKLIVQSFDWKFLAEMHKLEPTQPLAALGEKQMDGAKWAALPGTGARTVAWRFEDLNEGLVGELRRHDYAVWTWTPDKAQDWDRLIAMGVEGIITNQPGDLYAKLRDSFQKEEQDKEAERD